MYFCYTTHEYLTLARNGVVTVPFFLRAKRWRRVALPNLSCLFPYLFRTLGHSGPVLTARAAEEGGGRQEGQLPPSQGAGGKHIISPRNLERAPKEKLCRKCKEHHYTSSVALMAL